MKGLNSLHRPPTKLIFFLALIAACTLSQAQEKYPYQYGRNNGGVALSILGLMDYNDAKMVEILEYRSACFDVNKVHNHHCGEPVYGIPLEKVTTGNFKAVIADIPVGIYTFNVKYSPQGNNIWCTDCSKARAIEIVNDSQFICINNCDHEN